MSPGAAWIIALLAVYAALWIADRWFFGPLPFNRTPPETAQQRRPSAAEQPSSQPEKRTRHGI